MLLKVFKLNCLLVCAMLLSLNSPAAQSDDLAMQCRVGAELFKFTALNSAVSRVNWDFMSIDTANVVPVEIGCNAADISASRLIHEAFDALEVELATGHGRYSAELLNLYGCPPATHRSLLRGIRQTLAPLMLDPEYNDQLTATKASLMFAAVQDHINGSYTEQCTV